MKKSQNLALCFAAMTALMVAYVFALAQLPTEASILYVITGSLGACALAQMASDLMESRKDNRN